MLDRAIAGITDGFSFAYIQEAFVASLLAIAAAALDDDDVDDENEIGGKSHLSVTEENDNEEEQRAAEKDLEQYILWREMKKQIKILRKELGQDDDDEDEDEDEEGEEEERFHTSRTIKTWSGTTERSRVRIRSSKKNPRGKP